MKHNINEKIKREDQNKTRVRKPKHEIKEIGICYGENSN